jgi:hypothetical protein
MGDIFLCIRAKIGVLQLKQTAPTTRQIVYNGPSVALDPLRGLENLSWHMIQRMKNNKLMN